MVINAQAFNARGKDARRIYEELDDFQSRRPIDVIARNRPILILDEPQKMEGAKTVESLKEFNPLFILRYSATHKQEHNKIYRLDALDAYNQKLVKKIAVRGICTERPGRNERDTCICNQSRSSRDKPPVARVETGDSPRPAASSRRHASWARATTSTRNPANWTSTKASWSPTSTPLDGTLSFTNGVVLTAGDALGDVNETVLRRLQIREAVAAHFEKEQQLFAKGIKVLSLFFIDEVAKYRVYEVGEEKQGEYAQIFEEEYNARLNEILTLEDSAYNQYLRGIATDADTRRLLFHRQEEQAPGRSGDGCTINRVGRRGCLRPHPEEQEPGCSHFDEPVRFLFSHSALREGWDNPNVFVIGMLKHSDNTTTPHGRKWGVACALGEPERRPHGRSGHCS